MYIKRISVKNFRCHDEKVVDIQPDTTVITGKNGVGKTSIVEALYIALQGSSFKGSDVEIIKKEMPWYRIDITLHDDSVRTVTFDPSRSSGKKQFIVNDKKSLRLKKEDIYPIVLFDPDDLQLIHGSPSRRRAFIDLFIAQLNPSYKTLLSRYEKALRQRNALLKNQFVQDDDFFSWNITLSEYAAEIIKNRTRAIEIINASINAIYKDIAKNNDIITLSYINSDNYSSAEGILKQLEESTQKDKILKHTSVGPHRHDILFTLNGTPAIKSASRGEIRTIIIALKKVESSTIEGVTNKQPIIILDDVFSELDNDRRSELGFKDNQVIITSVDIIDRFSTVSI